MGCDGYGNTTRQTATPVVTIAGALRGATEGVSQG